MSSWFNRAQYHRSQNIHKLTTKEKSRRFALESLENRTLLAATLGVPTVIDPVAPVRVDQNAYAIKAKLQAATSNNVTVFAYRDTNQNGVYNAGVDVRVASAVVPKLTTSVTMPIPLIQNSNNRFFLVASEGGRTSAPATVPLITEDSKAPTVTGIKRVGAAVTNASSVQFTVTFSEAVRGVDASDFKVVRSGSLTSGAISVSGSGVMKGPGFSSGGFV